MNAKPSTIQMLLAPVLAVSLVFGGLSAASGSPLPTRGECCQAETGSECCGTTCCETPTPKPVQAPINSTKRVDDDPRSGKLGWVPLAMPIHDAKENVVRNHAALAVPASGSLSLVTQHIRLQI
ncbi:MAG: hypothetical protein KDA84_03945 [Planctomycetaceae bacterium]|nr:hypothetical protein [Planctomycetaceae bacterium]